ncbi:DUF4124 domain-containing protein [Parvibium lacunae]|uniref:DUF4124 domain-containing protein n=1 Tax=Parvibium lacunae TaxID=1888893 RepID=A0A368L7M4_9BURK|nr:DUF4124 domain-containing protein [Parvibium lacunae]RCS59653.1 DUF4124 domain-containing protein [Parvibium lacunae]
MKTTRAKTVRGLLVCGLLCSFSVLAQYQWRDANGNMQFSDRPPPGDIPEANIIRRPRGMEPVRSLSTPSIPSSPAPQAGDKGGSKPASLAEREMEFRKRQTENAEKAKKQADKEAQDAQRKAACEQQRNQLAALESGQRMSRFDASGERVVMEDGDRNAEQERVRRSLEQHCK